jgi:hypothetical protein
MINFLNEVCLINIQTIKLNSLNLTKYSFKINLKYYAIIDLNKTHHFQNKLTI